MNFKRSPQTSKHEKDFSFKARTVSTTFLRDSKDNPTFTNDPEDLIYQKNQIDNSADVSSFSSQSFEEVYGEGSCPKKMNHYKSDNESVNQQPLKLNQIPEEQGTPDEIPFIITQKNLIYRTDSELIEPVTSIRTPFLPEKPEEIPSKQLVFRLSGDLMGPWIFIVPMAFHYGGLYFSIAIFIILDLIIYYSEMLLVSCSILSKKSTVREMAEYTYGEAFYYICGILICLFHFCHISVSLVILNKILAHFWGIVSNERHGESIWTETSYNKVWIPIFFVAFIFPLYYFRKKIGNCFVYNKGFNLLVVFYILILLIIESCSREIPISTKFNEAKSVDPLGFLTMFPICCFIFCKADLALIYYQKMKSPNINKITKGMQPSRIINLLIVLLYGIFGYLTWHLEPISIETYNIIILAPYPNNSAWTLGLILIIISLTFFISESIEKLEMSMWIKNKQKEKWLAFLLMIFAIVFCIFIERIKEIMVWAGCLICSPVILFLLVY